MRILIIPGLNGSGPDHWQSLWERRYGGERLRQRDWANPDLEEWVRSLDETIMAQEDDVIIIAHSLGCLTVAQWAGFYPDHTQCIRKALLVAPPDAASFPASAAALRRFTPPRWAKLPFSSVLVGSENDPYMSVAAARDLARAWGSIFVNAGRVGHINEDSGHGPWPEGETLVQKLFDDDERSEGAPEFHALPCP